MGCLVKETAERSSALCRPRVLNVVSSVVPCDSCFIYVLEDDDLVLRASKNAHSDVVDRLKLRVGQGLTGWVAEHRQPVAVGCHAFEDPRFQVFNELPEDHYEAFLSVPVLCRGRLETENSELSDQLETRKLLDRAKGILQRDLKISEEEAYLTIQKQSRQRRRTKREICEAILLADDLRRGPD